MGEAEWTPEGLAAWERSMAEQERRSQVMAEGLRQHYGRDAAPRPEPGR